MNERERLIELMEQATNGSCHVEDVADYLLENGVMVPPCKVGDTVYLLLEKITGEYVVVESICKEMHNKGFGMVYFMHIDCPEIGNTLEFYLENFDRTVFLTKEEAEQALKEMKK